MEVIRKFVDAKEIMSIITLPRAMRNRRLEVIIMPAEEREAVSNKETDVDNIVNSLIGSIPDNGKTLEEYRAERLAKYENID